MTESSSISTSTAVIRQSSQASSPVTGMLSMRSRRSSTSQLSRSRSPWSRSPSAVFFFPAIASTASVRPCPRLPGVHREKRRASSLLLSRDLLTLSWSCSSPTATSLTSDLSSAPSSSSPPSSAPAWPCCCCSRAIHVMAPWFRQKFLTVGLMRSELSSSSIRPRAPMRVSLWAVGSLKWTRSPPDSSASMQSPASTSSLETSTPGFTKVLPPLTLMMMCPTSTPLMAHALSLTLSLRT
mmetsp:Transcript_67567/g.177190  ORF Transcript_67567/g.177190 Transcript_67567/m.177190 type:complete len:239 (-) Transcript_67567:3885-4601(-)